MRCPRFLIVIAGRMCYDMPTKQNKGRCGNETVSWNVNACAQAMGKGFMDTFAQLDADAFCLNETKLQPGQIELDLPGYQQYWNSAEKKGYSGVAVFTRQEPLSVRYGIGADEFDHEGRVLTLKMPQFYLVSCYTPNSQDGLKRLEYRMRWEDAFLSYLKSLEREKPVVLCGDLNVAHQELNIKIPSPTHERGLY